MEGRKEYSTPLLLIALLVLERSENSFSLEVVVFVFVLVSEREDWNPDQSRGGRGKQDSQIECIVEMKWSCR